MITQTLQDIVTPFLSSPPFFTNFVEQSLHWRADRTNLEAFNQTFTNLMANDVNLTTNDMADFKGMLATISFPPNPLRTVANQPPASIPLPGLFGPQPTNGGPRLPLPPGRPESGAPIFAPRTGQDCAGCRCSDTSRSRRWRRLASPRRAVRYRLPPKLDSVEPRRRSPPPGQQPQSFCVGVTHAVGGTKRA